MDLKYLRKFSIYVFLNGYINTIQSIIIKASTKLIEEFREECEEEYLKTFV